MNSSFRNDSRGKKILTRSPISGAEEFAIHDYEDFGGVSIDEYTNLETVAVIAEFIVEHDELGAVFFHIQMSILMRHNNYWDECYHGEYDSEEDFAESFAENTMEIPALLEYYVDYIKIARDLFINDFFSIDVNSKTHVFSYF